MTARDLLSGHASTIAPALLGSIITSDVDGQQVSIRVTEVEAYGGEGEDPGSQELGLRIVRGDGAHRHSQRSAPAGG